jgi:hypothetical protein
MAMVNWNIQIFCYICTPKALKFTNFLLNTTKSLDSKTLKQTICPFIHSFIYLKKLIGEWRVLMDELQPTRERNSFTIWMRKGRRLLPSRPRILLSCEVRCVLARIPLSVVVLAAAVVCCCCWRFVHIFSGDLCCCCFSFLRRVSPPI